MIDIDELYTLEYNTLEYKGENEMFYGRKEELRCLIVNNVRLKLKNKKIANHGFFDIFAILIYNF